MISYADVRAERRRVEELLRIDCARAEREGVDPAEIVLALRATVEWWRGELQDLSTDAGFARR